MSVSHDRLDHERMYLWVHTGLVLVGVGFAFGGQPAGATLPINPGTHGLLALALVFGSTLALIGAAMGSPWFLPQVHDIRIPYVVAGFGQVSVVAGLSAFVTIAADTTLIGMLSAGLAVTISAGCLHVTYRFIADVYKRSKVLAGMRDAHS